MDKATLQEVKQKILEGKLTLRRSSERARSR